MKSSVGDKQGEIVERLQGLRQDALELLFPFVREMFEPLILGGFRLDYGTSENELLKNSVHQALENLTVSIFEAWCEVLLTEARNNPARLLGLESLNQYMLPEVYDKNPFLMAQNEYEILSHDRVLQVLEQVGETLPNDSHLPQSVIDLLDRCGCLVVMRH